MLLNHGRLVAEGHVREVREKMTRLFAKIESREEPPCIPEDLA